MNTQLVRRDNWRLTRAWAALALASACFLGHAALAQPITSALTYQGELGSDGAPTTGVYDFRFRLYDAASGGNQIGGTLCSDNLTVEGGRFATTLDFGEAAFNGQRRFLEVEVRADTGLDCSDVTGYTVLTPRQELTAAPHATFAQSAATASSATTATNATQLNGQAASYYTSAANLTGMVADARLSPNVALLSNPGASQFAGTVGIGIAPTGGARLVVMGGYDPAVVDQSQLARNGGGGAADNWQSFTASLTGQLTGVRLGVSSPLGSISSPGTVEIYAGEGTSGQLLATQQVTYAPPLFQVQQFDFTTPPNITAGSVYTIRFSAPRLTIGWVSTSSGNPYAGGRYSLDANSDVVFATLVALPFPALTASGLGVSIGSAAPPPASNGLSVSGASVFAAGVSAASFTGSGAGLTNINAANITTGTLNTAQIPNLDASKINSGTLADDRLSPNVALLNNPGASQFAGAVGIGIAPTGGARIMVRGGYDAPVVDQSQLATSGFAGGNDQWQSFTAALAGQLTGIRLRVASPLGSSSSPGTIQIYAGEGTAGQLLATQQVTYSVGFTLRQFDFSTPPSITAGSVYTIRFSAPTSSSGWVSLTSVNTYAGGRFSNDSNVDTVFETLVALPRSAFTVSDSGVSIGNAAPPPASNGLSVSGASVFAAGVTASSFSGSGAGLSNINASSITSGTLATAQIPNLDATKITSGTLATAQIPNLDASKIISGTLASAQVPNLDASKITTGTLLSAQVPNLDASKITTGTLAAAQVPNLDASKITSGTLVDTRLSPNVALKNAANAFTSTGVTSFAGNIGIGTTTPDTQYALQVVSGGDTQIGLTGGPATGGATPPRTWAIQSSGVNSTPSGLNGTFQIIDRTAVASRLLIDTNGNVGIGTSAPGALLDLTTGSLGTTTWQMVFNNTTNTSFRGGARLANSGFFEMTNTAAAASPNFARLASTGAWTAVSDARLKTDVTSAEGNLAAAMKLRPVNFRWKVDGTQDFGMIAQEVREVLPMLVIGDESKEKLTVNYSQMSVVAIGAIQEQQQVITQLQAENAKLKARLAAIEAVLLKMAKDHQ